MKLVKLNTHQRSAPQWKDDLVIYRKDFNDIEQGDVVEIYAPEDNYTRLLLQVTTILIDRPKFKENNTISIEASIASTFQLRNFNNVIVNVVDKRQAQLDSVELFFKDQYLARSDMWLLKKHLNNQCVYLNKKIEHNNIRCQVFEMWANGLRMASGYVNEETKIVFRSASSMVYIFLQMSSEMWDYDINGDLYFEKAVNGFLADLFKKWKKFHCSHDVTIVFFSRTYYEANDISDFPQSMRECLQKDSKGRYFEDYYRVAIQNERYEDWTPTLIYLKKLFNLYEKEVIHYHQLKDEKVPKAYNSTASQGNFLEVLNMSLNVFERHNLDRSFDRTGQLSVIISPGVGVYEVDPDLTNITKQRIIDNGIGSDLVCLGEQPLHAVPLFKYHSAGSNNDEYNMPHWINLSFYSSKQRFHSNFIPRIKMPNVLQAKPSNRVSSDMPTHNDNNNDCLTKPSTSINSNKDQFKCGNGVNSCSTDFDEFDKQVFKYSPFGSQQNIPLSVKNIANLDKSVTEWNRSHDTTSRRRLSEMLAISDYRNQTPPNSPIINSDVVDGLTLLYEKPSHSQLSTSVENRSLKIEHKFRLSSKDDISMHKRKHSELQSRTKALINPFDPSHVTIKLNSNRRRWTHVFPIGPTGIFMQQHHYQAIPNDGDSGGPHPLSLDEMSDPTQKGKHFLVHLKKSSIGDVVDIGGGRRKPLLNSSPDTYNKKTFPSTDHNNAEHHQKNRLLTDSSSLWAWGATGELEWTPAITTGVDWKSLVMPACLPITTDFLPDKRTLEKEYVTYAYDLIPDDDQYNELPTCQQRCNKLEDECKIGFRPNTDKVYYELVCQRLQQGFQMILRPTPEVSNVSTKYCTFILSIGRIYHELVLDNRTITITCYHPRHAYNANNIRYCYRIRTPDNETYGVSWVEFAGEKLESYKWNYLDNYICQREEHELLENLKFWRFRLLVLPSMQSITRKIIEKYNEGVDTFQCDLYHTFTFEEKISLQAGFIKLLELINRIKRTPMKQSCKTEQPKSINRRNSAVALNLQQDSNFIIHQVTRYSQPADTLLSTINENPVGPKLESLGLFTNNSNVVESDSEDLTSNFGQLSIDSPLSEVIRFMKESKNLFVFKKNCLPAYTFISSEAIEWYKNNNKNKVSDENAEVFFKKLLQADLIRHISGNEKVPFQRGFFLYSILDEKNSNFFLKRKQMDGQSQKAFERDWMEVGVVHQHNTKYLENLYEQSSEILSSNFLRSDSPSEFTFKNMTLDLDSESRNGRLEWINVKYHSLYDPEQAFEIIIEWMVATGNAIPEVVSSWNKNKNTGLHIVPIPWDPFALPFSSKSDPLRGPIFISLNFDCLTSDKYNIFEGERLFVFQERILVKFGFIPFCDPTTDNQRNFVHVSGSIFVMIPNKNPSSTPSKNLNKRGKFLMVLSNDQEMACSPHEEYITRHFSGIQQKGQESHIDAKIGFLWCWNYMITKRWKTNVTGDENSMRKIMEDFRRFCLNTDNRLQNFWEEYCNSGQLHSEEQHLYGGC